MKAVVCEQFRMTSTDGLQVVYARWRNRQPPRGLLQIAHGMGEHIGRYQVLIEELVHAGLVVYGKDHRGHGRTARSPKELGELGPCGFNLMVKDMVQLSLKAREENPNQPFLEKPISKNVLVLAIRNAINIAPDKVRKTL